jgi:hypothetical protein
MTNLPLPTDWNPFWNRSRDLLANRIAKKRIICAALDRLEFDLPEIISVKAGNFTMRITPRLAAEKSLIRLRKKAHQLPEGSPPRQNLPRYPHVQKTINELEATAVQIYGNAAHSRLLWQLQHAADLGLDMKTTILLGDLIQRLVPVKLAKAA